MADIFGRRALILLAALVCVCGCGKDDNGGSSDPGGGPSPTPPPSGVVSLAGNWTGTSDFQQNGQRYISRLSVQIRQTDRTVEGNILFTDPGWSGWTATFTGQLSGNSPESQFFGSVMVNGAPVSGGGNCSGQMQMSGVTRSNTLRWEAPILTLRPTGTAAGSTVCMGDVLTVVWILGR
jgi:hypothetical protein